MTDYVPSLIRTWVPLGISSVVSWLIAHGVAVNAQDAASLAVVLTGIFTAIYYAIFRLLEKKASPLFGWFLGLAKQPSYPPTAAQPGNTP